MNTEKLTSLIETLDYGPAPESEQLARAWLQSHDCRFGHFINGEWRKPKKGNYFKTINPARSDETLAEIALGSQEDVEAALGAAKDAFPKWRALSGHQRARYLYAIARAVNK